MQTKSTEPITADFRGLDSFQTTEILPILPRFGKASANNAARLRLEIVLGPSGTKIALNIFSASKDGRLGSAANRNSYSGQSAKNDITDAPDALLAAILCSVDAGIDRDPEPLSILK